MAILWFQSGKACHYRTPLLLTSRQPGRDRANVFSPLPDRKCSKMRLDISTAVLQALCKWSFRQANTIQSRFFPCGVARPSPYLSPFTCMTGLRSVNCLLYVSSFLLSVGADQFRDDVGTHAKALHWCFDVAGATGTAEALGPHLHFAVASYNEAGG